MNCFAAVYSACCRTRNLRFASAVSGRSLVQCSVSHRIQSHLAVAAAACSAADRSHRQCFAGRKRWTVGMDSLLQLMDVNQMDWCCFVRSDRKLAGSWTAPGSTPGMCRQRGWVLRFGSCCPIRWAGFGWSAGWGYSTRSQSRLGCLSWKLKWRKVDNWEYFKDMFEKEGD